MILILSAYLDHSTVEVIDWLFYFEKDFKRLNGYEFRDSKLPYQVVSTSTGKEIFIDNIDLNSIKSVWYRRWIPYDESFADTLNEFQFASSNDAAIIKRHMVTEMRKSYRPFFAYLEQKIGSKCVPRFSSAAVDKIEVLLAAAESGLKTPDWVICNTKSTLAEFARKHSSIITKPLGEVTNYKEDNNTLKYVRTEIVDQLAINDMPESFFPSLFQEYIEKDIEIRSFFLEDNFYSMAIFTQLDSKTKVDFRNYNDKHPNRNVPFQIPNFIEEKLSKLMKKLDLNTGSIDLILNTKGDFYFLEVNPVGQFGMTSKPCNYYLEKKIAKFL